MPGFEDLTYVCQLRVFFATSNTLGIMNALGGFFWTENTKFFVTTPQLDIHPSHRQLFGTLYETIAYSTLCNFT